MAARDLDSIKELDQLVRNSHFDLAREKLQTLGSSKKMNDQERGEVCRIALRLNESHLCWKWLKPIFRDFKNQYRAPTDQDWLNYGMCLKQLGAPDQGIRILQKVSNQKTPDYSFYMSLCYFNLWRYSDAVPYLLNYLDHDLSEYSRKVGEINLASAYINLGSFDLAREILLTGRAGIDPSQSSLIAGNIEELLAQVEIYSNNFETAEKHLNLAMNLQQASHPISSLFVEKWRAVLLILTTDRSEKSLRELDRVRERAFELKHWETARDCDYHFSRLKVNSYLFRRLFFGTPFLDFRERLQRDFPGSVEIGDSFFWSNFYSDKSKVPEKKVTLDLQRKDLVSEDGQEADPLVTKTLSILAQDFYAPVKPFSLFLKTYPDESLDPDEALPRAFNAISKTKKWLSTSNLGLEIHNPGDGYQIVWTKPCQILVPLQSPHLEFLGLSLIEKIKQTFQYQSFSIKEAADQLDTPRRSVSRAVNRASELGEIEVNGKGPKTRYQFKV